MLRALDGDAGAYRVLLADLQDRLAAYFARRLAADRATAEDLTQEALLAIHAKRATFDRTQAVTSWTYAIAKYKLIDHFRRTGRRPATALDDIAEPAAPDESAAAEARADVLRGLEGLTPRARDLVVSVKLQEQSIAEVAARTGLSESAVKVGVHRGFLKMARRLRGQDGAPQDPASGADEP